MKGHEVTIAGDAALRVREVPAFAALPEGATRGVVVIHEIFGRQPEIDRVVERFAARGYAAVAPDLFAHGKLACIRAVMGAMRSGEDIEAVRAARHARQWLTEKTGIDASRVGLIGFCFGGGFALLAGSGWAAVSTNYGQVPSEEALRGIGPVIGCYGGRDLSMASSPEKLRRRLAREGVPYEVHTVASAGHSFLTDGHHPIASALSWPIMHVKYDAAAAAEGWAAIDAFLDRHLGG